MCDGSFINVILTNNSKSLELRAFIVHMVFLIFVFCIQSTLYVIGQHSTIINWKFPFPHETASARVEAVLFW